MLFRSMTTTVNKPGFGWDDEPNTTISPIKAKPEPNNDSGWGDDEPEKTPAPARRQFKTNELPLSSATRTAVEGLSHKFKKKGGFDAIRKQVWDQLEESVSSYHPAGPCAEHNCPQPPCV